MQPLNLLASRFRKAGLFLIASMLITIISACAQKDEHQEKRQQESQQENQQIEPSGIIAENSLLIRNARVFNGHEILPDTDILVERGIITAIGQELANLSSLPVIDVRGQTVTPGFIDAHTHSFFDVHLQDSLRFGVTTQLDMFTSLEFMQRFIGQRTGLVKTAFADLYSAGTIVTSTGGHGTQYGMSIPTIDSPEGVQEYIQARLNEGSDWIKIAYEPNNRFVRSIDKPTMEALIQEAHRQDRLAVVHISKLEAAVDAVEAGADGLVHVFSDMVVDDDFLALMQERDVFVIPTLSVVASVSGEKDTQLLAGNEYVALLLSASQRATLDASFGAVELFKDIFSLDVAYENVRKMNEAGVPVLVGTDAPNPGTAHGASIHEELFHFVAAGLSPMEALKSATSIPAEIFLLGQRGQLQEGARADLIVFEGKPDEVISDSGNISRVFKNGYEVERKVERGIASNASSAPSLSQGVVSTFDTDLSSALGASWIQTTDQMVNGTSSGALTHEEEDGNGFMRSQGQVETTFIFPWSGASLFFGVPNQRGQDWTGFEQLSIRTRGDARKLSVMLFSRTTMERPATVVIENNGDWQNQSIALADFIGAALDEVYGFAITAGRPQGEFVLDIDDVYLK